MKCCTSVLRRKKKNNLFAKMELIWILIIAFTGHGVCVGTYMHSLLHVILFKYISGQFSKRNRVIITSYTLSKRPYKK
jgi:hypothetical protein